MGSSGENRRSKDRFGVAVGISNCSRRRLRTWAKFEPRRVSRRRIHHQTTVQSCGHCRATNDFRGTLKRNGSFALPVVEEWLENSGRELGKLRDSASRGGRRRRTISGCRDQLAGDADKRNGDLKSTLIEAVRSRVVSPQSVV